MKRLHSISRYAILDNSAIRDYTRGEKKREKKRERGIHFKETALAKEVLKNCTTERKEETRGRKVIYGYKAVRVKETKIKYRGTRSVVSVN